MPRNMRGVAIAATLGIFLAVGLLASSAVAAPAGKGKDPGLVDCAAGDSIADALAAGVTNIVVRGVCDERIDITTSNVTITGENPGDGITYTADTQTAVTVRGAHEVRLVGLTISGPRRAVNIFAGGAVFIADSDFSSTTPDVFASFVGDNSFANVTNSTIGGLLVIRYGDVRLFGATINSPGAGPQNGNNAALTLNGGSVYVWGSDINGHVNVNWLSRVSFGRFFNSVDWGISTVSNTAGFSAGWEMQCSAYSAITAAPQGIVVDELGNALTTDDIIDFAWNPGDTEDCTQLGFPAPVL